MINEVGGNFSEILHILFQNVLFGDLNLKVFAMLDTLKPLTVNINRAATQYDLEEVKIRPQSLYSYFL